MELFPRQRGAAARRFPADRHRPAHRGAARHRHGDGGFRAHLLPSGDPPLHRAVLRDHRHSTGETRRHRGGTRQYRLSHDPYADRARDRGRRCGARRSTHVRGAGRGAQPRRHPADVLTEPMIGAAAPSLFVVVPCYNEAAGIAATLEALARQSDPVFILLLVDNASTDGTVAAIEAFRAARPEMDIRIAAEPEKGTGAAADTGFRAAIAAGASHIARTDADSLPRADWIAAIKRGFAAGALFLAGPVRPRT